MPFALMLLAQDQSPQIQSTSIVVVIVALLILGLVGWFVAAVVGFARAREAGAPARWFALSAACLIVYHLHLLAFALMGTRERDVTKLLSFGAFFNLFVFLGSLCAIVGFLRLNKSRPSE